MDNNRKSTGPECIECGRPLAIFQCLACREYVCIGECWAGKCLEHHIRVCGTRSDEMLEAQRESVRERASGRTK